MDYFTSKLGSKGVSRSHSGTTQSTILNVYTLKILKAAVAQFYRMSLLKA